MMVDFVRLCPKCSHVNPEYENLCAACQQFIGMQPSVLRPEEGGEEMSRIDAVVEKPIISQSTDVQSMAVATPMHSFYLEVGGVSLTVFDRSIVGQEYVENNATTIQVPAQIDGSRYIHRQHCSFHYRDHRWYVCPLDQRQFKQAFSNPTWINQTELTVGKEEPLRNGDILRLSGVQLHVIIP